jgi:myo-inositol-1(or 4)-monophosphatase
VALEWCWLAAGRCQLYVHGRQALWDYAAGLLVLEEAGGRATTLDGESVFTPKLLPRSVLAASNYRLFEEGRHWLAGQDCC